MYGQGTGPALSPALLSVGLRTLIRLPTAWSLLSVSSFSWVLILLAVAVIPVVSAGSAEDPELVDPSDDVAYSPAYVGPRDHAYIDIVAGWLSIEAQTSDVHAHFAFKNTEGLEHPPASWVISCIFTGHVWVAGTDRGELTFNFTTLYHTDRVESSVLFRDNGIGGKYTSLAHEFGLTYQEGGAATFRLPLAALRNLGESVSDFFAYCAEDLVLTSSAPPSGVFNSDRAKNVSRTFRLERTDEPSTAGEDQATPSPPIGSGTTARGEASGTSALLLCVLTFAVLWVRRRRL